jgi:hypothetical protein
MPKLDQPDTGDDEWAAAHADFLKSVPFLLMARRFQFSLGRLLSAVSLVGATLWVLRSAIDYESCRPLVLAFPILLGSAIGWLFHRVAAGAIAGVIALGMAAWLMLFAFATRILP